MIDEIVSIEVVENRDKYDLEIEDNHNFFANDILVHNCRCICIVEGKSVTFWSRTGNEFLGLDVLKDEILRLKDQTGLDDFVLDGEVAIVDSNGKEDFKSIVSQIKRKNHTIENPKYLVFDFLPVEDFKNKFSNTNFSTRSNLLKQYFDGVSDKIEVVDQIFVEGDDHLSELISMADEKGWEGLIIRDGDRPYEGKRSRYMLKLKKFHDDEFEIVGTEVGPFRVINADTGLEETIKTLTNIIVKINDEGATSSVGSGFSISERISWFNRRNSLIGLTATVQYFEKSVDKNGKQGLRFPTIKHIYDGERNV